MTSFFWTPHSGYHWDGRSDRFFEGWYLRLTLPEAQETFAFMYSIDDPAGNTPLSGGAAQILGPGEGYLYCPFPQVDGFWAWPHRLGLGHRRRDRSGNSGGIADRRLGPISPALLVEGDDCGYQVTATHHQGQLQDAATGAIARWNYTLHPVYGWGDPQHPPLATTGWMSYLPILEPGWQVLMAHGWATGWVEWRGQRYEFTQAPAYAEKNWGGAFPSQWFWMQCNSFDGQPDLTVTAVGALRQVLGNLETVGMVGIHYRNQCIFLDSLHHEVAWVVAPWGSWQMTAQNHRYRVQLSGHAPHPPAKVQVPTQTGLRFDCWDTTHGTLRLEVWHRSRDRTESCLLRASSHLAGLEVGGRGWQQDWVQGRLG